MQPNSPKKKEAVFKDEIRRCILMPAEERDFWIGKADSLPEIVLDDLTKRLAADNKLTDGYIAKALEADQGHECLTALKQICMTTTRDIVRDNEDAEKKAADLKMQKVLENT